MHEQRARGEIEAVQAVLMELTRERGSERDGLLGSDRDAARAETASFQIRSRSGRRSAASRSLRSIAQYGLLHNLVVVPHTRAGVLRARCRRTPLSCSHAPSQGRSTAFPQGQLSRDLRERRIRKRRREPCARRGSAVGSRTDLPRLLRVRFHPSRDHQAYGSCEEIPGSTASANTACKQ